MEILQQYEEECNSTVLNQPYPTDGRLYCPPYWDSWGCWNYTVAGTNANIPCPTHIEGFDPSLKAYRQCTINGTWWISPNTNKTWSNYTTCINRNILDSNQRVLHVFIAGYSISIAFLVASLFIFTFFKQLQCDRVTIHKNLFSSYILNGIVWILYYTTVSLNPQVMDQNPGWCQALHVVTQYFVTCNFFWMFCEGFYLHTIIVVAFSTGKKLLIGCCILGWVVPLAFTIIYTIIRVLSPEESVRCWVHESSLQWIIAGPIVATILINLIFLCNIVRVLLTKLHSVNSPDTNGYRGVRYYHTSGTRWKAVRATLILIPLLGLQYILMPMRPKEDTKLDEVYMMVTAFVISFQGFFVSLLFCFFNGEVHTVIKRRWGQHRLMTGKSAYPRSTYFTQTSMADQPATSPRGSIYDKDLQSGYNNGTKPQKGILKGKNSKGRKNSHGKENGTDYCTAENKLLDTKAEMENTFV